MRTDLGGSFDSARAVVVGPSGKTVAVGMAIAIRGSPVFAIARYHSNGKLDQSFSDDGRTTTQFAVDDRATAVVLQRRKIVVAGWSQDGGLQAIALARYRDNGLLDTDFGSMGKVRTALSRSVLANAVAVEPDGKIIVGGGLFEFVVAR